MPLTQALARIPNSLRGLSMSGNDIEFTTRTPESNSANDGPLRLRTWFDHTRNMMVVEVAADTPAETAAKAQDKIDDKAA